MSREKKIAMPSKREILLQEAYFALGRGELTRAEILQSAAARAITHRGLPPWLGHLADPEHDDTIKPSTAPVYDAPAPAWAKRCVPVGRL